MENIRVLFAGDFEDITNMSSWYNLVVDGDCIKFVVNIDTMFTYDEKAEIGRYNINEGYGILRTKKGRKDYTSLKALYNAINKVVGGCIDYKRVLELKAQIENELKSKEEVPEEIIVIDSLKDNKEYKQQNETIYTAKQLIERVNANMTENNITIANIIIKAYMTAKNFYQEDMIKCFNNYITTGSLNFIEYNLQF